MNLTLATAVDQFRKHWNYLAETGERNKYNYLRDNDFELSEFSNGCFLCEFVGGRNCRYCPIIWPDLGVNENVSSPCLHSYFYIWTKANTVVERKGIAGIIANLGEQDISLINEIWKELTEGEC